MDVISIGMLAVGILLGVAAMRFVVHLAVNRQDSTLCALVGVPEPETHAVIRRPSAVSSPTPTQRTSRPSAMQPARAPHPAMRTAAVMQPHIKGTTWASEIVSEDGKIIIPGSTNNTVRLPWESHATAS